MAASTSNNKKTANKPPAIFLLGPTASGKTALAFHLVDKYNCEIISVDSAQVYKGMNIGTAKPSPAELAAYPHHLIDIRDPADVYSAGSFAKDAKQLMQQISAKGKVPLLVGGTSLYFNRLLAAPTNLPPANPAIRQQLEDAIASQGLASLHQQLAEEDPASAAKIHPNDAQRILRALEVKQLTGKPLSQLWQEQETLDFPYRLLQLGLLPENRAWLHQRIESRFLAMLKEGLIEEVAALKARPDLHRNLASIKATGYAQTWDYLAGNFGQGKQGLAELEARGVAATRQLAKRQITWLRSWPNLIALAAELKQPNQQLTSALNNFLQV